MHYHSTGEKRKKSRYKNRPKIFSKNFKKIRWKRYNYFYKKRYRNIR